jgi:hypothetical protein
MKMYIYIFRLLLKYLGEKSMSLADNIVIINLADLINNSVHIDLLILNLALV